MDKGDVSIHMLARTKTVLAIARPPFMPWCFNSYASKSVNNPSGKMKIKPGPFQSTRL